MYKTSYLCHSLEGLLSITYDLQQGLPDYLSFTGDEVRAALARYITESGHIQVICRPVS